MCGISGFYRGAYHSEEQSLSLVKKMGKAISHRGPDDSGEWVDSQAGIALSHRRLSILDLSQAGHQPMLSPSERFVIVFNGEIYNHLALRKDLDYSNWRGHSDTETLLVCIEQWGLRETLVRSVGMFALALWDRRERSLNLARDRIGEKPLYYGWQGSTLIFGSELKAIRAHPDFKGIIDRNALSLLVNHGYINAPHSIYEQIYKLLPGTILEFDDNVDLGSKPTPKIYWSFDEVVKSGLANKFNGTRAEATDEIEGLIINSVRGQMLSDVPLGAFLSGGIDSSLMVALMQTESSKPINTFTIGFGEDHYNEAKYAKSIARHLGTHHTELYVTDSDAMEIIPSLPLIYDEPFGDSSSIPTYIVSRLARQHVTVALSGDGGDEIFGGYARYFSGKNLSDKIFSAPLSVRQCIYPVLQSLTSGKASTYLNYLWTHIQDSPEVLASERLKMFTRLLPCNNMPSFYCNFSRFWAGSGEVVLGLDPFSCELKNMDFLASLETMMYFDTLSYLPGDILAKVDRAAMAVGLETRVPLLDHRLVEFAWRLPLDYRVNGMVGKRVLRDILHKYIPAELFDRPKMGFGVPVDLWIRGPFREWAEDLLSENLLNSQGLFNANLVRDRFKQHLDGKHNWRDSLWAILSFQAWYQALNRHL